MKKLFILIMVMFMHLTISNIYARQYFNKSKDLLLAQFDLKPDEDDIHSAAALACMLKHSDLAGVNYFVVAGAYGTQGGSYITSAVPDYYNTLFGPQNERWTHAHTEWNASVNRVRDKVKTVINNGGKVFIQEAGESNFTYDVLQALISAGVSAQTFKTSIIVVQHSDYNENNTTGWKLTWVKNNTDYNRIEDGNSGNNSTPGYNTKVVSYLNQAKSSSNPNNNARIYWTQADKICDEWTASWENPTIAQGGVDFSDCVENWWIFNLGTNADTIAKFWSRYVTNTTSTTNPETISCGSLPSSLVSSSIVAVNVPYSANQTRDVVVEFWNTSWLGQGTTSVNAGSGVATVVINLSNAPAVGSGYLFKVSIRPSGGNWTTNIDACQTNGVSITSDSGGGGSTSSVTLNPVDDTYLQVTTNKNENIIRIENGNRTGYLKFDLSSISGQITDAKLKLTCNSDAGNGNINVNLGSSNNWTESNLTTNNAPSSGTLLGSLNTTYNIGTTYTWDLNEGSLTSGGLISFVVTATGGNDVAFASKENSAPKPELVITYSSTKSAKLDKNDEEEKAFKVYPNPLIDSELNIELGNCEDKLSISIIDMSGKVVYDLKTTQSLITINKGVLKTGYYIIKIRTSNSITTQKLLVK